MPHIPSRALTAGALLALGAAAANCSYWYSTTAHGPAFRNVRDFGAVGDGVHDDTAAIQASLSANQSGGAGSGLAPSAVIAFLPPGTYLISDTIVLWFWSNLVGSAACPPTLRLRDGAPGFSGAGGRKPLIATNQGYNVSLDARAWWLQFPFEGGHANNNFYVHARDLEIDLGARNDGAVAVLWQVAQQASLRNIVVDATRSPGALGFDQGGPDYAQVSPSGYSLGGGGSWEDLAVRGGAVAFRLAASQYSYRNISSAGAAVACIQAVGMEWTQTIVGLACSDAPLALQYHTSPGSVLMLDSALGPGLGPVAIATDGKSALFLQNVAVLGGGTRFVVDALLPVPTGGGVVAAWAADRARRAVSRCGLGRRFIRRSLKKSPVETGP